MRPIALFVAVVAAVLALPGRARADASFLRGDANADGELDVSDAVQVLLGLFAGGTPSPCEDAADTNDDGALDVSDAVRLLGYLFLAGAPLPAPGVCGPDETGDTLTCEAHGACGDGGLAALGDLFEGDDLSPLWRIDRPSLLRAGVEAGALVLEASGYSLWYQGNRGPCLSKLVTGDFAVTARVAARSTAHPANPPSKPIHLAGLMARNPASEESGVEDYVFVVVGFDENDLSVETKTTRASGSNYVGPPWPSGDAELRLERRGAQFSLWKRPFDGGEWIEAAVYSRPDLPGTLAVGPFLYAADASPDLRVRIEEVTFSSVE